MAKLLSVTSCLTGIKTRIRDAKVLESMPLNSTVSRYDILVSHFHDIYILTLPGLRNVAAVDCFTNLSGIQLEVLDF